jgi:hypothetical protein
MEHGLVLTTSETLRAKDLEHKAELFSRSIKAGAVRARAGFRWFTNESEEISRIVTTIVSLLEIDSLQALCTT